MKRIKCAWFFLVTATLLLLSAQIPAAVVCQGFRGDTIIVFGNGIMNTERDAINSRDYIKKVLKATLPPDEFAKLRFNLAYNQSYGFFRDFYESARQKALSNNLPVAFWRWLGNREAMPDVLRTEMQAMAARFDFSARVGTRDLENHVFLYRRSIAEGKKVVVVSHSQGNFFANAAYDQLFAGPGAIPDASSFGVVAVATPASSVAGNGPHTTLTEDLIIGAVTTAAIASSGAIAPPLPANVSNVGSGAAGGDWRGHGFIEEYMVAGSRSLPQIMGGVTAMISSRTTPPAVINDGIISVMTPAQSSQPLFLIALEPNGAALDPLNNPQGPSGTLSTVSQSTVSFMHYAASCETLEAGVYRFGMVAPLPEPVFFTPFQIRAGLSTRMYLVAVFGSPSGTPAASVTVAGNRDTGFTFAIERDPFQLTFPIPGQQPQPSPTPSPTPQPPSFSEF